MFWLVIQKTGLGGYDEKCVTISLKTKSIKQLAIQA
jgi:hypothetical protein